MRNPELDAHTTEQDRLDALEEARLFPIRKSQLETLKGFEKWLNDQHPSELPFKAFDPKNESLSPWIESPKGQYFELEGETNDPDKDTDAVWMVLWTLYQKSLT